MARENGFGATLVQLKGSTGADASPVVSSTLINRSGTITSGGVAQVAASANTSRRYLLIQNPTVGSESFWISPDTTAIINSPSIEIPPGMTLIFDGSFVPTGAVSVIATTTGTKFTVKEG